MSVRNPIVIAAACAVLGGATAVAPVSAAATTSTAGIGMPSMIVPVARHSAATNGPPTSAKCLASLGVACYSPTGTVGKPATGQ